ncbi:hypothetical protein [Rhodococcoides kyotonense]|uniref:Uncharacterized protein n=1 Tax=Rhodococcoides kyotonense TaxID=398843 RepID=A0A239MX81_9NOCA|nr:hypothetical protein [Rhodococcus kyotonensis]SNT46772.1 hypothetical protein SAMN05421642_12358 [Rhodococcus kyotonensis]
MSFKQMNLNGWIFGTDVGYVATIGFLLALSLVGLLLAGLI